MQPSEKMVILGNAMVKATNESKSQYNPMSDVEIIQLWKAVIQMINMLPLSKTELMFMLSKAYDMRDLVDDIEILNAVKNLTLAVDELDESQCDNTTDTTIDNATMG